MKIIFKTIILYFFTLTCTAQVGALDTTFGVNGNISTPVFSVGFQNHSSVRQSNGQYILYESQQNNVNKFSRFNADGSLDLTYGVNGYVDIAMDMRLGSMQLQTDGKLVAVGSTSNNATIARFNPDGTLDNSFGSNGIVVFSDFQGFGFSCMSIAPDQSIIAGSIPSSVSNNSTYTLCKVLPNGSMDSSFGSNGIMVAASIYSDGTNVQNIHFLNVQQDGKIVVSVDDNHTTTAGTVSQFNYLARFLANGSLDTTYGTNGYFINANTSLMSTVQTIQPDDKILIAYPGAGGLIQLFRYLPNGSLDPNFGTNGSALATIGGSNITSAILVQPDGKIVLVGKSCNGNNNPYQFLIVRYTSSGLLDTSFNTTGYNLVQRGNNDCTPYFAVHLQDDGKLVAIGHDALHFSNNYMTVFFRFISGLLETEGFTKGELSVSPNPVQNVLSVSNENTVQYELFTILGATIQAGSLAIHGQLDCSNLAKGMYLLKLNGENGESKVVKLVKE